MKGNMNGIIDFHNFVRTKIPQVISLILKYHLENCQQGELKKLRTTIDVCFTTDFRAKSSKKCVCLVLVTCFMYLYTFCLVPAHELRFANFHVTLHCRIRRSQISNTSCRKNNDRKRSMRNSSGRSTAANARLASQNRRQTSHDSFSATASSSSPRC